MPSCKYCWPILDLFVFGILRSWISNISKVAKKRPGIDHHSPSGTAWDYDDVLCYQHHLYPLHREQTKKTLWWFTSSWFWTLSQVLKFLLFFKGQKWRLKGNVHGPKFDQIDPTLGPWGIRFWHSQPLQATCTDAKSCTKIEIQKETFPIKKCLKSEKTCCH